LIAVFSFELPEGFLSGTFYTEGVHEKFGIKKGGI